MVKKPYHTKSVTTAATTRDNNLFLKKLSSKRLSPSVLHPTTKMRLAVDIMGGDHGPAVIVNGAFRAIQKCNGAINELHFVGDEEAVQQALREWKGEPLNEELFTIHHTNDVLLMMDKPVEGLRRKKNCSLAIAIDLAKKDQVDAVVSPGNTGGVVAAATIKLRTLPGVDRAGIATVIPRPKGMFLLLDAGASADCRASHLLHFAIMGSIYMEEILGVARPRVGLLSVGTEPSKGNELTLEAFPMLEASHLNFIGNVEGHDLYKDNVDVVVCDGFTGNIVLKTSESLATNMFGWIKQEMTATPLRKLGALLCKPAFKPIRHKMNPDTYGGAPLLGVNGNVMITHGSAKEIAIENAIGIAIQEFQHNINKKITDQIRQQEQPDQAA